MIFYDYILKKLIKSKSNIWSFFLSIWQTQGFISLLNLEIFSLKTEEWCEMKIKKKTQKNLIEWKKKEWLFFRVLLVNMEWFYIIFNLII